MTKHRFLIQKKKYKRESGGVAYCCASVNLYTDCEHDFRVVFSEKFLYNESIEKRRCGIYEV